jgi:surface antigen
MQKILLILMTTALLTACATTTAPTPQQIANAPLVTAGLISPGMAKNMASEDADKIQQLIATAGPQMEQTWKNPLTHDTYQFNSQSVAVNVQGQACRDYQIKTLIDGSEQQIQANACRQADGTWQAAHHAVPLS